MIIIGCLQTPVHTLSSAISLALSPFYDHSFPIIADNKQIYIVLTVPSGLLPLHIENLLDIYPIATSFLRKTHTSTVYTYSQMFIAGAFKILTHKAYNRTATTIMISEERQFNVPLTVEIRNIRSSLFRIEEWCLAKYIPEQGWECVGNLTETETGV